MKKTLLPFSLIILLLCSGFMVLKPIDWQLTEAYSIRVSGKKIDGFFHKLKGKISFDENNLSASQFNLEVEVASLTTGNSLKSWHAKKAKWLDAKHYPTITFNSSKIQKTAKGYLVNGKLNLRGIEKEVAIPFSFSGNIFFGNFYVKRSDYKVGSLKGMSKMVSDSLRIDFTIPVVK